MVPKLTFSRYVISKEGIHLDECKIEAIRYYPTPKTSHEVPSFYDLSSFYPKVIKNFSTIDRMPEGSNLWMNDDNPMNYSFKGWPLQHSLIRVFFCTSRWNFVRHPFYLFQTSTSPFEVECDVSFFYKKNNQSFTLARSWMGHDKTISRMTMGITRSFEIWKIGAASCCRESLFFILNIMLQSTLRTGHHQTLRDVGGVPSNIHVRTETQVRSKECSCRCLIVEDVCHWWWLQGNLRRMLDQDNWAFPYAQRFPISRVKVVHSSEICSRDVDSRNP